MALSVHPDEFYMMPPLVSTKIKRIVWTYIPEMRCIKKLYCYYYSSVLIIAPVVGGGINTPQRFLRAVISLPSGVTARMFHLSGGLWMVLGVMEGA